MAVPQLDPVPNQGSKPESPALKAQTAREKDSGISAVIKDSQTAFLVPFLPRKETRELVLSNPHEGLLEKLPTLAP